MRAEEQGLRAEPVLAGAVGRVPWALSHLLFGMMGPAVALAGFGLTAGLVYGLVGGDVGGALAQLPAVWVLSGIAAALFGLLPRLAPVSWAALAVFAFLALLGPLLRLDRWVMDASPFSHLPRLPGGEVAAVLAVAGLSGFRRRDVGVA